MNAGAESPGLSGLLGDTAARNYADKLVRFHAFAAAELTQIADTLALQTGMHVLDAGCGTGEMLRLFHERVGGAGLVVGLDLSQAHTRHARAHAPLATHVVQANALRTPLAGASFDLVWSLNTVNHLRAPLECVRALAALLKPDGRLVLAQSSFLADMFFAWDARLERVTNEAVRRYYQVRYGAREEDFAGVRSIVGLLRAAGLAGVSVRTWPIERVTPLSGADEAYLLETQFRGTWGERLRPYLAAEDFSALQRLCDPADAAYALRRPDFHYLQTLSVATGVL